NSLNKNFDISRQRVVAGSPSTLQKDSMALNITAAPKPITIDDNNKTLMVSVDGTLSQSITLSKGSYATMADLAAEMQSKINGDETLARSGKKVGVAFNEATSKFDLSSSVYGSTSKFKIVGVGDSATSTSFATLGLTVGGYMDPPAAGSPPVPPPVGYSYTAGADVEGLIGGEKAKGAGQALTGTGQSEGLSLIVTASTAGDYGTVAFNRGVAFALDKLLDGMVKDRTGLVAKQTDGVTSSITQLAEKRVRMNRQYDATEALYRKQFTAMDIAIATLKSTSSNLTAQLAGLSR
ncbi:MAG: flagellar filament capping protein FliD, partial [Burkholderiales bacterium]|nr:flagellar filament capping protein FliD [Burkholderiales bacterium]